MTVKLYVISALISLTLAACTSGIIQVPLTKGLSTPSSLQSGAGAAIYEDQNGMPVTTAFLGLVATSIPFWVQVVDQYGNPAVPTVPIAITFSLAAGSGSITSAPTVMTDPAGKATGVYLASSSVEDAIILANGYGAYPVTVRVASGAGSMSKFTFGPTTSFVASADEFRGIVYATDTYGNVTTSYTGSTSLTWNSSTISPVFAAADLGRKTFQITPFGQGTFQLSLTDGINSGIFSSPNSVGYTGGATVTFSTAGSWNTTANWTSSLTPTSTSQANFTASCTSSAANGTGRMTLSSSTFTNTSAGTLIIFGSDLSLGSGIFSGSAGTINFNTSGWTGAQEIFPGTNAASLGTITGGGTGGVTFGSGTGLMSVASLAMTAGAPLYINGNVSVTSPINLQTNSIIQINAGGVLSAQGGISAASNGSKIIVLGGGSLLIGPGTGLASSSSGVIQLAGTPTQPAVVDVIGGTGTYSVVVGPGGSFLSDYATIGHLGNPGIALATSATQFALNNSHFGTLASGSTVLSLGLSPKGLAMNGLIFDDSASPGLVTPINASNLTGSNVASVLNSQLTSGALPRLLSVDPNHALLWNQ